MRALPRFILACVAVLQTTLVGEAALVRETDGQLVEIAVTKGRATRPNIKLGICGEHGGDPASILRRVPRLPGPLTRRAPGGGCQPDLIALGATYTARRIHQEPGSQWR